MLRIINIGISDARNFRIVTEHVNRGFKLHVRYYLGFNFSVFDHNGGLYDKSLFISNRPAELPENIRSEDLPGLFQSIILKNQTPDAAYILTPDEYDVMQCVYAFEKEQVESGVLSFRREIPAGRAGIAADIARTLGLSSIKDINDVISIYEDIREYGEILYKTDRG